MNFAKHAAFQKADIKNIKNPFSSNLRQLDIKITD